MTEETFPAWRYGPNGGAMVCETADDVPAGWVDHPAKVKEPKAEKPVAKDPFDHDGDGEPGGSKPKAARRKVKRRGPSV